VAHGYLACNRFIDNENNADVILPTKEPRLGTSEELPKIEDKEEILL
jgi:hypothetical protein